jgi:hypothetical protein
MAWAAAACGATLLPCARPSPHASITGRDFFSAASRQPCCRCDRLLDFLDRGARRSAQAHVVFAALDRLPARLRADAILAIRLIRLQKGAEF